MTALVLTSFYHEEGKVVFQISHITSELSSVLQLNCQSAMEMMQVLDFLLFIFSCLSTFSVEEIVVNGLRMEKTPCPTACLCENSNRRVRCVNKSLTAIPNDLPKSTMFLDISKNKNIHIPETFFANFSSLKHLDVSNCGLHKHFDLPKTLMTISIYSNALSLKEFLSMFSSPSRYLINVNAHSNRIEINKRVSLLENASSIRHLALDRQRSTPVIYKETFKALRSLRELSISNMDVEQIEDNAFADLVNLTRLNARGNKLYCLPQHLFKPLRNLIKLDLSKNQLKFFPNLIGLPSEVIFIYVDHNKIESVAGIENMDIKSIRTLDLSHNCIRILPNTTFQNIAVREIFLFRNKLERIEPFSFKACDGFLRHLILCNNNISYVSPRAFRGLSQLASLLLFGNNISTIHSETFKDMHIHDLFLYNNSISLLPAFWKSMKKPPSKLFLFDNPLKQISDVSVGGMQIYLSCDKLRKVSGPINLNSTLSCLPSEKFSFQLPYGHAWIRLAAESGYNCSPLPSESGKPILIICKPCPLGYVVRQHNICSKCPPGAFYQDQFAQLSCKFCRKGQFVPPDKAPGKTPLECNTCPEGTQTNESAGYRACRCLHGFFRKNRFGSCMKCETKGVHCENDYQTLAPNFWWTWEHDRVCLRKYLAFVHNLKIKNDSYSRDSMLFDCPIPKVHQCPKKGICLGGILSKCRKGYTGTLCVLCQSGYYKHFKSCAKCPELWIVFLQLLAYVLLFIFICVLVNWADKLLVSLSDDQERSLADVILSILKILLGFYQVLNGTVTSFSYIPWPRTFNTAIKMFRYIELEILRLPSLRCVNYNLKLNAVTDFWISMLGTILVPFVIYLYYITRKLIHRGHCRTRLEYLKKSNSIKKTCFRSTMIFLFSTYPITSRRILQLLPFACRDICYDSTLKRCVSFIKADYSVKCLVANPTSWLLYVVYACIVVPSGFPILLLFCLRGSFRIPKRREPHVLINDDENCGLMFTLEENEIRQTSTPTIRNETLHFASKFLYENYRPSCWFWEVIEMYRKLLLTSLLPIFASESRLSLAISIIFSSAFTVLHAYAKPIKDNFENHLQLISLSVIPLNLCIGYILETIANQYQNSRAKEQTVEHLGIGVLLLILNSLLILILVTRIIKIQIRKIKILLTEDQCSCRCCMACILPCVSGRNIGIMTS